MKKIIIYSMLGLITLSGLTAQNKYSIEQCRTMALENNNKIKNSDLAHKSAEEAKKEAFTNYFPSVDATGMTFKAKNPMISTNMGGMPIGLLEDGTAGAIMLSQPVFAGGRIINGNKLAKVGVEVQEQQKKLSSNEVVLGTDNLYWALTSLHERVETINLLEEQLQALLKDVQVSHDAGLITLNDVLQVKLKLNEIKSSRINLNDGIDLTKMALCQKMGLDLDSYQSFDIERNGMELVKQPFEMLIDHNQAVHHRAESALLDKNVEAHKLQVKMQRGEHLPTIAVGATVYQQNMMDTWNGNSMIFVSVSVPISKWWGGSHAIKRQKIQAQIANNDKVEGEQQLLLQMRKVQNELNNAYQQIQISKESIAQSVENMRLNNDYYKVGMVKLTDVLDAQSLLQQSRDKYVDAVASYQFKSIEYMQVTGR